MKSNYTFKFFLQIVIPLYFFSINVHATNICSKLFISSNSNRLDFTSCFKLPQLTLGPNSFKNYQSNSTYKIYLPKLGSSNATVWLGQNANYPNQLVAVKLYPCYLQNIQGNGGHLIVEHYKVQILYEKYMSEYLSESGIPIVQVLEYDLSNGLVIKQYVKGVTGDTFEKSQIPTKIKSEYLNQLEKLKKDAFLVANGFDAWMSQKYPEQYKELKSKYTELNGENKPFYID